MAAEVTIVSANLGGFDVPRDQADQDIPVDWLLVTDLPETDVPEPWAVWPHPASDDSRRAAKRPKMLPAEYASTRYVIWLDASMEITSPAFARLAVAAIRDGLAVWAHPRRDCVYEEISASLGSEGQDGKYADQPLVEQGDAYRAEGHPEHAGLYACGTIAWDTTDPTAMAAGRAWLEECGRWSIQDQVSLPVVLRRMDIAPGVFPVRQIERRRNGYLENRWVRIHPHSR